MLWEPCEAWFPHKDAVRGAAALPSLHSSLLLRADCSSRWISEQGFRPLCPGLPGLQAAKDDPAPVGGRSRGGSYLFAGGAGSWWRGAAGVVLSACRPGWSHRAVCRVRLLFVKGDGAHGPGRWGGCHRCPHAVGGSSGLPVRTVAALSWESYREVFGCVFCAVRPCSRQARLRQSVEAGRAQTGRLLHPIFMAFTSLRCAHYLCTCDALAFQFCLYNWLKLWP